MAYENDDLETYMAADPDDVAGALAFAEGDKKRPPSVAGLVAALVVLVVVIALLMLS